MTEQIEILLPAFPKGYHLITHLILEQLKELPAKGILHIFIKHTSAGITINERDKIDVSAFIVLFFI